MGYNEILKELYLDFLKEIMIYVELICKNKKVQISDDDKITITDWLKDQIQSKNKRLLERQVTRFIKKKKIRSIEARNEIFKFLNAWVEAKPKGIYHDNHS